MLENKNILIVSPFFFDYHIRMKTALTDMGANVDVIDEQPNHSAFARILMRKDVRFYHKTVDRYFDRIIPTLKKDYDYILFIKCEAPTVDVLKKFKRRYPYAKKILYLWDSVANIAHITKKFAYFNKIFSFDKDDVKRYSFLEYAYWGYTKEFEVKSDEKPEYDVSFVGTLHSVRPKVLSNVERQCRVMGLNFYKFVYIPHPLVFWYNKLTNPYFKYVKRSQVHFKPLSTQETIDIYKKSFAVLEVENSYQSGATTRLGEMIGMQKKIITTFDCRNSDFYRKENELIINPADISIRKEFFDCPYQPIPEEISKKYSFNAFLEKIFGC